MQILSSTLNLFDSFEQRDFHLTNCNPSMRQKFLCFLCGNSYEKRVNWSKHMKEHELPFLCKYSPQCGFRFATIQDRAAHYTTVNHPKYLNSNMNNNSSSS